MKELRILGVLIACVHLSYSQDHRDTMKAKELKEVIIRAWQRKDVNYSDGLHNAFLTTGKKNEVITLASTNANVAIKTARQLFAKVPGVFVYDMDGSGNQLNIATRGLDPHRSWEYNIRQNGILTNSDMYGYPASHYSPPVESFDRIELVRGTGSLQYGAQFGGMINYVTKQPDSLKAFGFESINTVGSFGLLSTYNAISGTKGKFSYYAYYHKRHAEGYRNNSNSDAEAQFVQLNYRFTESWLLKLELGRSKYLYQIPGPLTDSMFAANPKHSTRSRNYFSPDIYVPSISLTHKVAPKTTIYLVTSAVLGTRNSVQFDAFANIPDSIQSSSGTYANRQIDIDRFDSKTFELKLASEYNVGSIQNGLSMGLTFFNNDLHRRQLGKGTTSADYDLTVAEEGFKRDIHFKTNSVAMYAENAIQIARKLSISPGIRVEQGKSEMTGKITYYPSNEIPNSIRHSFVLIGVSSKYALDEQNEIYGGISEAYRPVIFKDIVPASVYETVDNNLKNAFGYNAELGVRGKLKGHFQYDVSYFRIKYNNRLGTLVEQDNLGQSYTYKTNVGNSLTNGLELFAQYKFPLSSELFAGMYTSTSFINAHYTTGQVSTGTTNKSIKGNRVEAAPRWISRNGVDLIFRRFSASLLYSYTSDSYADALNTQTAPPSGARGYTPAYGIWDLNVSLKSGSFFSFRAGINNILDKSYFTKRPTFYPGPGIWPSDGRNFYLTVGFDY